eukprot:6776290-Prymnesium_polylepis.1
MSTKRAPARRTAAPYRVGPEVSRGLTHDPSSRPPSRPPAKDANRPKIATRICSKSVRAVA